MISGNTIKKIRELKGFTQEEIALRLNISQKAYSNLENNITKLDIPRLQDIAGVFDMDLLQLLAFDEKQVFNNCTQSGIINTIHNYSEKERELYEARIKEQAEMIEYLKKKLEEK